MNPPQRRTFLSILALSLPLAAGLPAATAMAQGLDAPDAIDSIVQSDVHEEEARAGADTGRIIAAIERSGENASAIRKVTKLERLDIVFLTDATPAEGGPPAEISDKLVEHGADIDELRRELTGNAMLFHAVDSRSILIQDVLAIEFDEDGGAIIYAAARPDG